MIVNNLKVLVGGVQLRDGVVTMTDVLGRILTRAGLHVLAMERGKVGERYILGGENISLKGLYRLVDEISGKTHRQFTLPAAVAMV